MIGGITVRALSGNDAGYRAMRMTGVEGSGR